MPERGQPIEFEISIKGVIQRSVIDAAANQVGPLLTRQTRAAVAEISNRVRDQHYRDWSLVYGQIRSTWGLLLDQITNPI